MQNKSVPEFETFVRINLDYLSHNIAVIRQKIGGPEILAVLKADAYGQGAGEVFKTLRENGIKHFAVANIYEALELRRLDPEPEILVFGYIAEHNIPQAADNNISLTVYSEESWRALKKYSDKKTKVHIKINTGFNRLGFEPERKSIEIIRDISNHPFTEIYSIYSHLSLTDEDSDKRQAKIFFEFTEMLEKEGLFVKYKHLADSIGTVKYEWARFNMVRLGAVMYGLKALHKEYGDFDLKGTLQFISHIVQIRNIKKGDGISYDKTFIAEKNMKIGVACFGYADGYPRSLSNKGYVLVNGKKAMILGLICMDQCVVDLTDIPDVKAGDEVLVYETDHSSEASLQKISELAGTNKNSIIASLNKRVHKVYIKNNKEYTI